MLAEGTLHGFYRGRDLDVGTVSDLPNVPEPVGCRAGSHTSSLGSEPQAQPHAGPAPSPLWPSVGKVVPVPVFLLA